MPIIIKVSAPHQEVGTLNQQNVKGLLDVICSARPSMKSADPQEVLESEVLLLTCFLLAKHFLREEQSDVKLKGQVKVCITCALKSNEVAVLRKPGESPDCPKFQR